MHHLIEVIWWPEYKDGPWWSMEACRLNFWRPSKMIISKIRCWWLGYDVDNQVPTDRITLGRYIMMASSNGSIFSVTGPLWGEFTGHRSILNNHITLRDRIWDGCITGLHISAIYTAHRVGSIFCFSRSSDAFFCPTECWIFHPTLHANCLDRLEYGTSEFQLTR